MTSRIPPNTKLFRAAVVPMFICVFVLGALLFNGFVMMSDGLSIDWSAFTIGAVASLPNAFVGAMALWYFFPAAFSVDGIYGHSFWGVRRFIRWSDIVETRTFWLINLRYLRLYSKVDRSVTWVALFQSHKAEFRNEIVKLAPPQNPILKHLENRQVASVDRY